MFPLVLPGEVVPHPDIGESLAATCFAYMLLKRVTLSDRIARGRMRLAEHFAHVKKMGLGTCVF